MCTSHFFPALLRHYFVRMLAPHGTGQQRIPVLQLLLLLVDEGNDMNPACFTVACCQHLQLHLSDPPTAMPAPRCKSDTLSAAFHPCCSGSCKGNGQCISRGLKGIDGRPQERDLSQQPRCCSCSAAHSVSCLQNDRAGHPSHWGGGKCTKLCWTAMPRAPNQCRGLNA
jgi:hypothetical protein